MLPAPTGLSSFSLHDALPISRCVLLRAPVPSHAQAIAWLRSNGVERAEAKLAEAGGAPLCVEGVSTLDPRQVLDPALQEALIDRKSTRLNSSHSQISYAVFCL